jgi:hypothetical protein
MEAEKIDMIMKSSISEEEKKKLINKLLGVKERKKREYTPQQIEASKQRLQMARDAKKQRAKAMDEYVMINETRKARGKEETEYKKAEIDVKAVEDIFEKKYSSEMAKMGDLLLDLNKNIGEMAKIKKQKAEQKKLMDEEKKRKEEEKPKEEPKKEIVVEQPKVNLNGKVAFPNYRNIFGKK